MGDARLLEQALPVEQFNTPALRALIADMRDTMHDLDGAGLAAPQIGVGLQVVIFGVEQNPRYPDAEEVPQTVLINPKLSRIDDEMEDGWEGCLSVPGMRGLVPRFIRLLYQITGTFTQGTLTYAGLFPTAARDLDDQFYGGGFVVAP